ncbi:membrane protein [Alkalihalobacillus pseudalcaliphilus]|nr:membrane protein [Alkalihalobacillus pseudalcaliphilus]
MGGLSVKQSTKAFRIISYLEGASLVLLLFLAMPLKYIFDIPSFVSVIGMAHGVLFMVYIVAVFVMVRMARWSLGTTSLALLASVIPFGPFIFDKKILEEKNTQVAS